MAKSRSLQQAVRFALTTATAAAGVSALHAQEAPAPAPAAAQAPIQEVVVTGSRIQIPNETSISPITTVSAVDIQQTGLTRVEDVLNTMPQVFAAMNSTTSNGADGTAAVDLRGLGNQRTLVLVNGLRLGPGSALGGRNYSDINQIPAALIERVDVLTGGASAVYGADAVAGVVNFILNTHFEGIKVDAGYHFNQHNNDNQTGTAQLVSAANDQLPPSNVDTAFGKSASVIMGSNFNDNKGNATAYITYDNQGAALQSSYDYAACTLSPTPAGAAKSLNCAGSSTSAKNGAGGRFLIYGSTGLIADQTVDGKTNLFRPFQDPQDTYNYGPLNYYQTPNERWTAGAFVNYDINSHINVYSTVMYMRNTQDAQIAQGGDFFSASFIPCANPLLNASEQATFCNGTLQASQGNPYETYNGNKYPGLNVYYGRRNVEGDIPRTFADVNDAAREVLGMKGDFGDALSAWTYNAYAQHSTVDSSINNLGYFANNAIQQSLNCLPSAPGSKTPVCGGPTNFLGAGPLVAGTAQGGSGFSPAAITPWNVWTSGGVTAAQVADLYVPVQEQGTTTEYVADGSVTGDLGKYGIKVPWADSGVQMNVGVEWRQESSNQLPDYVSQQGAASGSGGATPAVSGAFNVKEVFTEINVPIAQHQPWAEDLSFDGGYRYSKYSEGFNTNTYKLGLEYAPIRDIRFRGGYQRAVRAPNVGELYTPQAVGLDGTNDPCAYPLAAGQSATITPGSKLSNGVTFAQCARTGVTATQFGNIQPNTAYQYNGLLSGTPTLQPEEADTYTFGAIVTPRWVQNLSVSVDYFKIRIDQRIGPVGANAILNDCISNDVFCSSTPAAGQAGIHRDPGTGSLWLNSNGYVIDPNVNQGSLQTEGIDIAGNYRLSLTGLGSLLFSLQATRLIELTTTPLAGGPNYDCVGLYGATCGGGNPKFRSVFNVTWSTPWDGLDVNVRWRYFGNSENEATTGNLFLAGSPWLPLAHVDSYSWFDLSGTFNLYKNIRLELGVNNITDKVPPLIVGTACSTSSPGGANCNGNTFPGVYDAMGRYLFAHISAQF